MAIRLRLFVGVLISAATLGLFLILQSQHQSPAVGMAIAPPQGGGYCMPGGICHSSDNPITATSARATTNATVVKVVDGDTFVARLDTEKGEWKVRMLGINTPETVDPRKAVQCFGKQASARLHELLGEKRIRLVADPRADERDKYDRLLRNVMLEDGTDVNALMIREGYAYAYLSFPLDPVRKRELKQLQEEAKASGAGLWSSATCSGKF